MHEPRFEPFADKNPKQAEQLHDVSILKVYICMTYTRNYHYTITSVTSVRYIEIDQFDIYFIFTTNAMYELKAIKQKKKENMRFL